MTIFSFSSFQLEFPSAVSLLDQGPNEEKPVGARGLTAGNSEVADHVLDQSA